MRKSQFKKGHIHSEETIKKIIANAKINPLYGNKGKHFSEEHKKRISESNRGKRQTEESLRKMVETRKKNGTYIAWNKDRRGCYSEETLKKFSISHCGAKHPLWGKHHSEATRKKMSISAKLIGTGKWIKGNKWSDSRKKQLSESRSGKKHPFWGKTFSKEHRQKISEGNKGKILTKDIKEKISKTRKERKCRLRQILPKKDTSIEVKLQKELQLLNIPFEKHKPIIGQPDIFLSNNICIFADGDFFHCNPKKYVQPISIIQKMNLERDYKVNKILTEQGYTILRFWEHEINNDINGCIQQIQSVILWNSLEMVS